MIHSCYNITLYEPTLRIFCENVIRLVKFKTTVSHILTCRRQIERFRIHNPFTFLIGFLSPQNLCSNLISIVMENWNYMFPYRSDYIISFELSVSVCCILWYSPTFRPIIEPTRFYLDLLDSLSLVVEGSSCIHKMLPCGLSLILTLLTIPLELPIATIVLLPWLGS